MHFSKKKSNLESFNRWALTHPSSISESEKIKNEMKPDFLDMVPWYSGYV